MTNNPYPEYPYSTAPQPSEGPTAEGHGGQEQWAGAGSGDAPGSAPDAAAVAPADMDSPPDGGQPLRQGRLRRWATPVIVGLLAFVVGIAAGAGGESEEAASDSPAGDLDAELSAAVAEVEDERDALAAELVGLESERDGLAADLVEVSAERDELAGAIDDARADRDEALDRVEVMEAETEEAQAEAEEAQATAEAEAEAAAEAAEPSAAFSNGTWRVGEDIEPGTYRTEGAGFCYWERLSGFSGEFGDIISNGAPEGPDTVTIQASDAGFSSQGCGEWELME